MTFVRQHDTSGSDCNDERNRNNSMIHIIQALTRNAERYPNKRALCTDEGAFLTWKSYHTLVKAFGHSLLARDTKWGDRVMILASNSVEWFVCYLGTISVGAIPVGLYCTNTRAMCTAVFEDCTPSLIVCDVDLISNVSHLDVDKVVIVKAKRANFDVRLLDVQMDMKKCNLDGIAHSFHDTPQDPSSTTAVPPAMLFRSFIESGTVMNRHDLFVSRVNSIRETEICSIIYTSGTTGDAKGCMLTHRNFTWTSESILRTFPYLGRKERLVSYLPLSHVAAQLLDIHCSTRLASTVYFTDTDSLQNNSLINVLQKIRPTVFLAVPRVWEKVCDAIGSKLAKQNVIAKEITTWALQRGKERMLALQYESRYDDDDEEGGGEGEQKKKNSDEVGHTNMSAKDAKERIVDDVSDDDVEDIDIACDQTRKHAPSCEHAIANSIVLNKIKQLLGLHKTKLCFNGAAPLSKDNFVLLGSMGICVYDIYGQTETTGPHSVNAPTFWKIGTSGLPLAGTESAICKDTGEILVRGAHVAKGYWKRNEQPFTDKHGWYHTGDVGRIDQEGFLRITGRIKELIITSGGENISPVSIEQRIKLHTGVDHAIVVGDARKFLTALLFGEVNEGVDMDVAFGQINKAACSRVHTIKKWVLLPNLLSVERGDLTPTMKPKRKTIIERYAQSINDMYADQKTS